MVYKKPETEDSKWITKKEKSEGGIVKRYKGGLMVKPKRAKGGY